MTTTVHTLEECRRERREATLIGVWIGAFLATLIALVTGIFAARYQERGFAETFAVMQAQHRGEIEAERRRIARYAEIDELARAMDAALGEVE